MKPALAILAAALLLAGCGHPVSWQQVSSARGPLSSGRWSYGPPFHVAGGVVYLNGVVYTGADPFKIRLGLVSGPTPQGNAPPQIRVTNGHLSGQVVRDSGSFQGTTAALKAGTYRVAIESDQDLTTGFVVDISVRR
jgi:hypothetical protein